MELVKSMELRLQTMQMEMDVSTEHYKSRLLEMQGRLQAESGCHARMMSQILMEKQAERDAATRFMLQRWVTGSLNVLKTRQ